MGECLLLFLTHPINNEGEQESFNGKTASRFRYLQGRVAERSEATLSMEYARKQRRWCCFRITRPMTALALHANTAL